MSDLSDRLRQYADIAEAGGKQHWAEAMREAMYTLAVYRDNSAKEQRENANLRAQLAEAQRDAERFLWMTADHDNADVRERVVNLCNRLPMMSTSAVRMYIDAAMQEGKP